MTENKRFSMKGSTILECGEEITAWDCCDLLNELHEENDQLKKELHKLKLVNEMLSMDFSNSEHELWRENEQLRKELENNIASYKKCNRRVFDLIDKKIKEVDTIGAEVLKDLRRELME